MIAKNIILNTMWELEYKIIDEDKIEILRHECMGRINPSDINYPRNEDYAFELYETGNRIVKHVMFGQYQKNHEVKWSNLILEVVNPKHVFKYHKEK